MPTARTEMARHSRATAESDCVRPIVPLRFLDLQARDVGPHGSLEPDHGVHHAILDLGPAFLVQEAAGLQAALDAVGVRGGTRVLLPVEGAAEVVLYGVLGGCRALKMVSVSSSRPSPRSM